MLNFTCTHSVSVADLVLISTRLGALNAIVHAYDYGEVVRVMVGDALRYSDNLVQRVVTGNKIGAAESLSALRATLANLDSFCEANELDALRTFVLMLDPVKPNDTEAS